MNTIPDNKFFFFIFLFLSISVSILAQPGNTGMRFSHFGGTMSTFENPAFGANSHTKWDVQLFNFNQMLEIRGVEIDWQGLVNDGNFKLNYTSGNPRQQQVSNSQETNFSFRNVTEIMGPAVFYNYKKKYAFGINTRARFFFQLRDANLDLADAALSGDNFDFDTYGPIVVSNMNLNMNVLSDIGLTGSALVFSSPKHKLYAGASLRFYKGAGAIDFTGKNISIDPDKTINADTVVEFSADMQFNSSLPKDIDLLSSNNGGINVNSLLSNSFGNAAGSGIGGDIGVVYQGKLLNRSIKVSASITDIGSINYNNGTQRSASFIANNVQIPIDSIDNIPSGYDSIKDWAASYGVNVDTGASSFTQALPTRFNLYGEIQVLKGFHVGVSSSVNLSNNKSLASSYSGYTAIIPRWQSRMAEVWMPISYNYFSDNLKAGIGARLAVLYFGTDDLLSLAQGNAKSANFYVGMRIAGNHSKRKVRKAEE